jgi:hypothetical protein
LIRKTGDKVAITESAAQPVARVIENANDPIGKLN